MGRVQPLLEILLGIQMFGSLVYRKVGRLVDDNMVSTITSLASTNAGLEVVWSCRKLFGCCVSMRVRCKMAIQLDKEFWSLSTAPVLVFVGTGLS